MKKNKKQMHGRGEAKAKKISFAPAHTQKKGFLRRALYPALLFVVIFVIAMYGSRCVIQKVCGTSSLDRLVRNSITVTAPKGAITAEVVDTKASRELGLSGRVSMDSSEGMIFVFDDPGRYGFWMKDMKFPLDIIWINDKLVVVEVERHLAVDSYPKTFMNKSPARYILEVNQGRAEELGLYIGSKVKFVD